MKAKQINQLQHLYGNAPIYDDVNNTSNGKVYLWNKNFINVLNQFFKGLPLFDMTKAESENINKFLRFADKEMVEDDEDYKLYQDFDIYLGSLK